jgi:hypothetical protein
MRRAAILLALTSLQVLAALGASPAETWTWFRTVSTGTEWWITQGKGEVDFSDSRFKATLRDAENPEFTRLSLQGSVTRGLVKARVTVVESDAPVFEVSGRLKRLCWPTGGGREILILTNGQDVVGLVRELGPSMPCKPAI